MRFTSCLAIAAAAFSFGLHSQQPTTPSKTRVFVTDSQSWEQSGGFVGTKNGAVGASRGGARPQTAEIIKTIAERCAEVTVTQNSNMADYVLLLDHEGGKGVVRRDNKFALFNKEGDAIGTGSTRSLGNAVKDACEALRNDLRSRPAAK